MRHRTFALIAVLSTLLAALLAGAQPTKVPYLGYMSPGDIPRYDNAFLRGLQEQGYILPDEIPRYDDALWRDLVKRRSFTGQKIRIEIRATAERSRQRAPQLAAELVRLNVDLIFVATPTEAQAARQAVDRANKTIPIVFGPQYDPVGGRLVASLARPGGNITGLMLSDPELEAKRLEILKETLPRRSRVAYLRDPSFYPPPLSLRATRAVQAAARAMGLQLEIVEVRSLEELDGALAQIARGRAEAMLVLGGPLLLPARHRVIDFAATRRLPAMYSEALFVEAGGLMFYGTPFAEWYGHSAAVVAKILKGAKPADIPVEQPRYFKLLINSKTAVALGVTIPQSILLRAEKVDTLEP
jgi:putative ABC transport system substrate-binding protein